MRSGERAATPSNGLELWGGYECTVNRVGDSWFDQTPRSGHEHRIEDLELFAGLGIRSLRYPVLWERTAPISPDVMDFRWADERLHEIRRLGMNPIVTLCHHGSGPRYTSLLHETFATGLARHAAAVAQRYPWVTDWTPVNEPLTTARFSALYGYWYPHTTDEAAFWVALLNEIDATRLAMREIRKVNPAARLIQTDDLGYCHATEPLQCEADFQNERRWMGWDLLCGMVKPGHRLYDRLTSFGLEDRLRAIADDPCPPDVIGINHYLSSERLLDHRVELHPDRSVADKELGECAGTPFVDVDAIRNWRPGVVGLPALLTQAWERYGLPIAVTECHNGASREEQVRWFVEVWNEVAALRDRGVDVRAVTAWSLLGSHDWNRMVTRFVGHYETGVYDCRGGSPRPTLLAGVLADLAAGRKPSAPVLDTPGWWRRELRFLDAAPRHEPEFALDPDRLGPGSPRPLLILGDDGDLTRLLARACEVRGLHHVLAEEADATLLHRVRPWAVFDARDHDDLCATGGCPVSWIEPEMLEACEALGIPCGVLAAPGARAPSSEALLVARSGPVYMPWDPDAPAVRMLRAFDGGAPVQVRADRPWRQIYGPDLIDGMLDLLLDGARGEAAFEPLEGWTEADFALAMSNIADGDPGLVEALGAQARPWTPARVSFAPPGETTLERFVREGRGARRTGELGVDRKDDDARLEAAE